MTLIPLASPGLIAAFAVLWMALCIWGLYGRRDGGRARISRPIPWVRLVRRLLIGVVLTLALLGPSIPAGEVRVTTNVEVYFAIDRTGSMAAEDWTDGKPRLDGVRRDVEALVDATSGSRYAVLTWDSTARLELPVTTDSSAVIALTEALHQEVSEFSAGSSINRPLASLQQLLVSAKESRPENSRYLIVLSDGESTDPNDPGVSADWQSLAELIDGGSVIGYGTDEGGPMRIYRSGQGVTDEYMADPEDPEARAISRLDRANLQGVADDLGVELLVNPSVDQVQAVGQQIMAHAKAIDDGREMQRRTRYLLWPLGIAGAGLLIWELAGFTALVGRMRRSRAI